MGNVNKTLPDGYYWHLPKRRPTGGIFIDNWIIIQVLDGVILFMGNDMEFPVEERPGKFERIPDHP